MWKRFFLLIFTLLFLNQWIVGTSYFEEGEKLLLANNPVEAKPLLEEALNLDPLNELIYLYLATVYEQLNDFQNSFTYLKKGVAYASNKKYIFYYNMGNNLFSQGQNTLAEEMYTKAIIDNSLFSDTFLNRANARLNQQKYKAAILDYKQYLQLKPNSSQRPQIEEVIRLLQEMLAEEERLQQEAAERDKNLKNLLNSLQNAQDNTQNISAGADKIKHDYEEEDDIPE